MAKTVPVFKLYLDQGFKDRAASTVDFHASSWGHNDGHMPYISARFRGFWAIAGQGRKLRPICHSTALRPAYT